MSNKSHAYLAFGIQVEAFGDTFSDKLCDLLGGDVHEMVSYGITRECDGHYYEEGHKILCAKVYHTDWDNVLGIADLSVDPAWSAKLQAVVKGLDLTAIGEPSWQLFTSFD